MKRCVVILVRKEDKFLVGNRNDSGKISFPAGHINPKETPREAAERELKEETGLNATKLTAVQFFNLKPGVQVYVFQAEANGDLTTKNDPDKEFIKLSFEKLERDPKEWHVNPKDNVGLQAAKKLKV